MTEMESADAEKSASLKARISRLKTELASAQRHCARLADVLAERDEELTDRRQGASGDLARALQALHMLHEQAHGDRVAFRFCGQEPCRDLDLTVALPLGPAEITLVGAGR